MEAHASARTASSRRPIGEFLVERGLVTPQELEDALAQQRVNGKRLGEILVERGSITRMALASVLGEQWEEAGRHLRAVVPVRLADGKEAETGLAGGEELTQSLASLQSAVARLEELAGEAAETPRAVSEGPAVDVAEALERLQAELEEVKVVIAQPIAADESLAERLGRIEEALSALPAAPDEELLTRLDRLESVVIDASVGEHLRELRAALAALSTSDGGVNERLDRIEHALEDSGEAGAVEEAIGKLRKGLENLPRDAELAERLDRIEGALEARAEPDAGARFDELHARLGELEAGVSALAQDERSAGIVAALDDVRGRLDGWRPDAELLERLGRIEGALWERGGEERLSAAFDELRAELRETQQSDRVLAALEELRGRLDGAQPEAELLQRLDRIEATVAERGGDERFSTAVDELRAELREKDRSKRVLSGLEELRARIDDLRPDGELAERLGRIEGALEARSEPDAWARFEELHARLAGLEAGISALGAEERPQPDAELFERLGRIEGALWERDGEERLSAALDQLRAELRETEQPGLVLAGFDELRAQLQAIESAVASAGHGGETNTWDQPDGPRLGDVLAGLAALHEQLDGLRPDGELLDRLARIEAATAEQPDQSGLLEELERTLAALRAESTAPHTSGNETEVAARVAELLAERFERLEATLRERSGDDQPAFLDPDALAARVDMAIHALRSDLVPPSAEEVVGRIADSLDERFTHLESAVTDRIHEAAPDPDELARRVGEGLADRLDGIEAAVRDRPELARIDELRARVDVVCERLSGDRDAELVAQLGRIEAELGAVGTSAREELAGAVGRLDDELANRLEELLSRVGGVEQAVRESVPHETLEHQARRTEEVGEALRGLDARLAEQLDPGRDERHRDQLSELLTHSHAALVERLDGLEEALTAPPPAVVPPEPEPDPYQEPTSYVAMLSSGEGYRLIGVEGRLPRPGTTLDLPEAGRPLVVSHHGRSPLPGDRRRCVYLEAC
jgi:hypothetical protein